MPALHGRYRTDSLVGAFEQKASRIGMAQLSIAELADAIAADPLVDEAARELALERCDDRYYTAGEDIAEALFGYIAAQRAAIALG